MELTFDPCTITMARGEEWVLRRTFLRRTFVRGLGGSFREEVDCVGGCPTIVGRKAKRETGCTRNSV